MRDSLQISVRQARLEDMGRVGQLEARVWKGLAAPPPVIQRRFFLFPQGFQIAVTRHDIVGFCFAALLDQDARTVEIDEFFPPNHIPGGKYCFLFGLTVNPIYRRRGVASNLIHRELAVARRNRCAKVQAIANARSMAIFAAAGFQRAAALSHLFQSFEELMPAPVLMELSLRSAETPANDSGQSDLSDQSEKL